MEMEYKLELLSYLLILKKKNEQIPIFDEKIKYCINTFEKNKLEESDLLNLFDKNVLDINPSIRSVCWKIALKHLSLNTKKWNTELYEKRKLYEQYIKSFVKEPIKEKQRKYEINEQNEKKNETDEKEKNQVNEKYEILNLDVHLNANDENWRDSELFNQINKDIFRTRSELSFFNLHPDYTITCNMHILNSIIDTDNTIEDQDQENEVIPRLVSINETDINDTNINTSTYKERKSKKWDAQEMKACDKKEDIKEDKKEDKKEDIKEGIKENKTDINLALHVSEEFEKSSSLSTTLDTYSVKSQKKETEEKKKNHKIHSTKNSNHNSQYDSSNICDIVHPKRHYDLICRILFIYARIHPYIKYVQGMNEILAPLYFIIFNDPLCNCALQGEADTFFCFTELMQRQKDIFCEGLDNTDNGINGKLEKFSLLFKLKEQDLWNKLHSLKIETQYYALKWILLLFNQDFDMADTIILYDQFIINDNENFILYICLAILKRLKQSLLSGNFSVNLKLLQNIPHFDPYEIIFEAKSLMQNDEKKKILINDLYAEYVNKKRKKNSNEHIKDAHKNYSTQSSLTDTDYIWSYENDKFCENKKNTTRNLLNNIKNKPIVINIKNYINNKIDEIQKMDESQYSDNIFHEHLR